MNLLLDDHPLLIPPTLAKELGSLNEAAFMQQLHYWLDIKKQTGKNFVDGRYWVYNSVEEWLKQFPWMTSATLRRTIAKLVEKGYVIKDNHSPKQMDHTCWYTINYDKIAALSQKLDKERAAVAEAALEAQKEENVESLVPQASDRSAQNEQNDLSKLANRSAQNEQNDLSKSANRSAQNEQIDLLKMSKSNCSKCANRSAQNEQINYYTKTNYTEINHETTTTTSTDVDEEVLKRFVVNPQDILFAYNKRCPSFPQVTQLTRERWRALYDLYDAGYQTSDILHVFDLAEQSDFLSGRSKDAKWDRFDFDWLLQLSHFVNVLEGKYNNLSTRKQKRIAENEILQNRMSDRIRAECTGSSDPSEIETPFLRQAMQRHTANDEIQEAGL